MGNSVSDARRKAARIVLRPVEAADIYEVGSRLREADKEEIVASLGTHPIAGLAESVAASPDAKTILIDGRPAAICGCPDGVLWLLGTPLLTKDQRLFVANMKRVWNTVCEGYDTVGNFVYKKNKQHIRWLTKMGCTFSEIAPGGRSDFLIFEGPANV